MRPHSGQMLDDFEAVYPDKQQSSDEGNTARFSRLISLSAVLLLFIISGGFLIDFNTHVLPSTSSLGLQSC
jgi:hypothetical protein